LNRGRPHGLTGGPHAWRRRLPNRLPHLPGERAASSRRRLEHAELGRREGEEAAGPQDAEPAHDEREEGETGRPRLGRARGASWAAAQAGLKGEEGRREREKKDFSFFIFPVLALIHH
jgi:hypothetical protein